MNTRRHLVLYLCGTALIRSQPLLAQAQPGKAPRIGFIAPQSAEDMKARASIFREALEALGYVEGNNIQIEWRYATIDPQTLFTKADELVKLKVDIIVAFGQSAWAAQKATKTIPIVMIGLNDPVGTGMVTSLARPGGNVTGTASMGIEISSKYLEFLKAVVPKLSRAAMLTGGTATGNNIQKVVAASAQKLGVKVLPLDAVSADQIDHAFEVMRRERIEGLAVMGNPLFYQQRHQIASLALKYRIPTLTGAAATTEAGGLMSYGAAGSFMFKRAATYVDKILKGAKPADLPVELPSTFELAVNLKTAKTLGLTIPQSILVRATKVIE